LFEAESPDLVFMDMRMPVMDGYEATRRIKATPKGAHTPIIALTASAFEHERAPILACGCDDFIRKPVSAAEVFDKIAQHLGVQFITRDQSDLPDSPRSTPTIGSMKGNMTGLPREWQTRLNQAARAANADDAIALIECVRPEHPALAAELTRLVSEFRFDTLMNVTDELLDS